MAEDRSASATRRSSGAAHECTAAPASAPALFMTADTDTSVLTDTLMHAALMRRALPDSIDCRYEMKWGSDPAGSLFG